jgi:hypothetical protein
MRKLLLIALVGLAGITQAANFYEGTLIFTNGSSKTGLVESPFGGEFIFFKANEAAKIEKFETTMVSKIIFTIKNEKKEYHQLKVYLGWKQERISEPQWLEVVEKGIATLYVVRSTMSSQDGLNKAGFLDYYVIRKGEPAAKMIANVSTLNNNQTFKAKAPLYFKDYPELASKIESKEYTWKDLTTVIQEYNTWATKKK